MKAYILFFVMTLSLFAQQSDESKAVLSGSPIIKISIKDGKITSARSTLTQNSPITERDNPAAVNQGSLRNNDEVKKIYTGTDLSITQFWITCPRNPLISFNCQFVNYGADVIAPNSFAIDAFLSYDENIDASDQHIWRGIVGTETRPYPETYVFPANQQANIQGYPDGIYNLLLKIDATNALAEIDEDNNTSFAWNTRVTIGTFSDDIDLSLSNVSIINNTNPAEFSYSIRNRGTYSTTVFTETQTGVYLSHDTWINTSDLLLSNYNDPIPSFGNTYTRTVTGFGLNGLMDGNYYIGIVLDYDNTILETDESNNYGTNIPPITILTYNTDLYPFNIYVTDGEGPEISYSVGVLCASDLPGVTADVWAYLSMDQTINPADDLLLNMWNDFYFTPGIENILSVNDLNVSTFPNGSYYLGVFVDPANTLPEYNEAPNSRTSNTRQILINNPPSNIDLAASGLVITDAIGPEIGFTFDLSNLGTSGTVPAGSFQIQARMRGVTDHMRDIYLNTWFNENAFDPGSVQHLSFRTTTPTLPAFDIRSDEYTLEITVDILASTADVNRANNFITISSPHVVIGDFNLSVYGVTISDAEGPAILYGLRFANLGTIGTIPINTFYLKTYLSDDQNITTSDYLINSWINDFAVPPVFSIEGSHGVEIAGIPDGNYYLGLIIDPDNFTADTDPANNVICFTGQQISISGGTSAIYDLSLSAINITDPVPNEIGYNFMITNTGSAGIIPQNSFYIGEFLSSDATINTDDYKITEWLNPVDFTPGSSYYYNSIRNIADIPAGSYYYGVILDLYNNLSETDETNNTYLCNSTLIDIVTDIENRAEIPAHYKLFRNYPNPFNPETKIKFALPHSSKVKLEVYDIIGNLIATLVDQSLNAGFHQVTFNASGLSSGVYISRLVSAEYSGIQKMILSK